MSEILKMQLVNASAPDGDFVITALDIDFGASIVRIFNGYENIELGGHEYIASNIVISLPDKSTNGQQNLSFGIWNATGEVQKLVDEALESNTQVKVIVYQYLDSDLDNFVSKSTPMVVTGGEIKGIQVSIEASYQDLLNSELLQDRYTSKTAKGIQYT